MTASIPAAALVDVIPGVLGAGGSPLSLNAVFLTSDPSIPIGKVQGFANVTDVINWFGAGSPEAIDAGIYFSGYTNCTALPGTLWFAQFNSAAVDGYLRGASIAALTLAQIQALSGTITLSIDGQQQISAAINLSAATSFSNAATLITAGIQNATGRFNGTASQATSVVTIATTVSGSLAVGDILNGAGVDGPATITSFGTYTVLAGTGTVNVSTSATVSLGSATVAGIGTSSYDSQRQAFVISSPTTGATSSVGFPAADSLTSGLLLTAATGAVLSPGAAAAVPATLMETVVAQTQNWATFMTVTEQILSVKEAFAAWVQTKNKRYIYSCQDSDVLVLAPNASSSFGPIVNAANDDGIAPVYDVTGGNLAAFQCAFVASINFNQQNGRPTAAFKSQAGIAPQITNETQADNLEANGYNFYGAYATANSEFTLFQNGQISGEFKWLDTFANQIYLNSQFQLALMTLLTTVPAVPYVTRGYNLIRLSLLTPIKQFINYGGIVSGVQLSGSQSAALNNATGDPNATATIQNTGWYLQILDPGAVVRGGRGSPTITFWYTDGGAIQKIVMSSIDVL